MKGFRPAYRMSLSAVVALFIGQGAAALNISGIVTDSAGVPIADAAIKLEATGTMATSGQDGKFALTGTSPILAAAPRAASAALHQGGLYLSVPEPSAVTLTAFGVQGRELGAIERRVSAGSHLIPLPQAGAAAAYYRVEAGAYETVLSALSGDGAAGAAGAAASGSPGASGRSALSKAAADALYDVITVTKTGYLKAYLSISSSEVSGAAIRMLKTTSPKFSFFVTSMKGLQDLSTKDGFGGDFRFGETGPGAGLRGADRICAALAEKSMPSSANKGWRAFLSVTADASGKQVNAIDRIGEGPWYDRIGRVMAPAKADLIAIRPKNGDPTIQNDLPNENGIPNHRPDPTVPAVDNHHTITGSDANGKLKSATATCKDWTTKDGSAAANNGKPSAGFSWPRGGVVSTTARDGSNWMTTGEAPGCAAGIEIVENGPAPQGSVIIGGGGGYGGFYCFALNP